MKGSLTILAAFFLLTFAGEARSQWQNGNLALKINGNNFRPGDQLKLEALRGEVALQGRAHTEAHL